MQLDRIAPAVASEASRANSDKVPAGNKMHRVLDCTVDELSSISLLELVEEAVQAVDEVALGRLRRAIAVEDGDEEEQQLKGVLRMLGAEIPDETQIPLFGKAPAGQAPKP